MLSMVPGWAREQKEFWEAIRRRNLWFIKLRYIVVLVLISALLISTLIFRIELAFVQFIAVCIIITTILVYNLVLQQLRKYIKPDINKFNPLDLSLLQIVLDLVVLLLLVHFTGGIESPLYILFVFHMIAGSLILPGGTVYSLAIIFEVLLVSSIILEYMGILPHHHINGLFKVDLYKDVNFIIVYLTTFTFMIFVSVYLANGIARQLYKREKDLVDSIKKIGSAEKEKQKYIMGIVHEIKTPIVAVASYIDIILQKFLGPIDETIEEKLVRAKNRTDEGIQMINDVLNVSKLTLYDQYDEEEIDIDEIIAGVIKRRTASAEAHLISLKQIDKREKKQKIEGDKFLLDIAISNLIGNSIKYGIDEGNIEITINSDSNNLYLEVCDDGVGIPEDELPKIFKEFYRARNVKKIVSEGSGLGLSVVKRIIERHGGRINVESPSRIGDRDHPGTCFRISIPFGRKEE